MYALQLVKRLLSFWLSLVGCTAEAKLLKESMCQRCKKDERE